MNAFDSAILGFLNRFAHRSFFLDEAIESVAGNTLFKGGLLTAVLWGLWFAFGDQRQEQIRKSILATFVGTFAGLFVVRVLVHILPFRPRPIHNTAFTFVLPYGVTADEKLVDFAMSFPSDHAALCFGLVTGIILVSRRLGLLVLAYVVVNPFLLRVYLGYHHPTDVIVGALIGVAAVMLANTPFLRRPVIDKIYEISRAHPAGFYGAFFVVSYQVATQFDDSRLFASGVLKSLQLLLG